MKEASTASASQRERDQMTRERKGTETDKKDATRIEKKLTETRAQLVFTHRQLDVSHSKCDSYKQQVSMNEHAQTQIALLKSKNKKDVENLTQQLENMASFLPDSNNLNVPKTEDNNQQWIQKSLLNASQTEAHKMRENTLRRTIKNLKVQLSTEMELKTRAVVRAKALAQTMSGDAKQESTQDSFYKKQYDDLVQAHSKIKDEFLSTRQQLHDMRVQHAEEPPGPSRRDQSKTPSLPTDPRSSITHRPKSARGASKRNYAISSTKAIMSSEETRRPETARLGRPKPGLKPTRPRTARFTYKSTKAPPLPIHGISKLKG